MSKDDLNARYREMFGTDPFRPRNEFDVDVHPESLRGKALALMDATAAAHAQIEAAVAALPWSQRWPARGLLRVARFRWRSAKGPGRHRR